MPSPVPPPPNPVKTPGGLIEFERRTARWWHPLILLAVLAGLYLIGEQLGWRDALGRMHRWIESFGYLAPLVFALLYVVGTVLGLPSSPFTAAAGVLFGAALGFAAALVASMAAATISFLIARHLAPAWLTRRLERSRTFHHLNRLVHRRGAMVVLATRLVTILPFAVINYGFGLTGIRLRTYLLWSLLGKTPGIIVLVVGIDVVIEAIYHRTLDWPQVILVLVIAAGLTLAVRRAKRWLDDDNGESGSE